MNILVVEDEQKIADFLKEGLSEQGHDVDLAEDGQQGLQLALSRTYDIILLDLVLPSINGIEVCKVIKSTKPGMPVLMLTARGTTEDKLTGFDAGADDYLVKPFEFKELMARIRVLTRRAGNTPEQKNLLTIGDLTLDLDKKLAMRQGKKIELTAREFMLLEYLMRNRGRVLSRADIAENVWDINFDTGTNVVEVYINILRKKIDKEFDPKLIHTRIGLGYVMEDGL